MAIGLDIRRPAKEDFMSFSVLHEIGSEVIPAHLPVTPASQADVELRRDRRDPLATQVLTSSIR